MTTKYEQTVLGIYAVLNSYATSHFYLKHLCKHVFQGLSTGSGFLTLFFVLLELSSPLCITRCPQAEFFVQFLYPPQHHHHPCHCRYHHCRCHTQRTAADARRPSVSITADVVAANVPAASAVVATAASVITTVVAVGSTAALTCRLGGTSGGQWQWTSWVKDHGWGEEVDI